MHYAETHPPSLIPLLLLAQNLFSKQIVPTDNIRPKSDDAKLRHWWLKGQWHFFNSIKSQVRNTGQAKWLDWLKLVRTVFIFQQSFQLRFSQSIPFPQF